jgi:lysophospholipase L1-like esterase
MVSLVRAGYFVALLAIAALAAGTPQTNSNWVAAWATAPADAGSLSAPWMAPGALNNRTVRDIVHVSVGGAQVRIRLSNALGADTLRIGEADLAIQQGGPSLIAGSTRAVTFGGSRQIAVPAGAFALSDPVALSVSAGQNIAVSLFIASTAGPGTYHPSTPQDSFYTGTGNFAAREDGAPFVGTMHSWHFLGSVDVLAAPSVKGTIVAFGDSTTDGDKSSLDGNQRWPDHLARRLASLPGGPPLAIVNAGLNGNRLVTASTCFGSAALARLDRDVLSLSGIRAVILLEGINDFLHPEYADAHKSEGITACLTSVQVSADDIIAGYRQVAAQIHAKGLRVFVGTMLPLEGCLGWS